MEASTFLKNFSTLAEAPNGVKKLREMILQLAVQGKLVEQDHNDEPATGLVERARILKNGAPSSSRTRQNIWIEEYDSKNACNIPQSWQLVALGNMVQVIRGVTFPASAKTTIAESGLVPCLRTANVQKEVIWDDLIYISPSYVKREDQWIAEGDVLISMANSYELVGKVCIVRNLPFQTTLGGFIASVRTSCMDSDYLLITLRENRVQKLFREGSSQTTNIANISIKDLQVVPIPLPPLAEQKRIVAKVDQLMGLCDELEARQVAKRTTSVQLNDSCLDALLTARKPPEFAKHWNRIQKNFNLLYDNPTNIKKLRQSIIQLAVMGKLVKQDPNDEPASVLLKRINQQRKQLIKDNQISNNQPKSPLKESDLPTMPNSWEWAQLGSLISLMDSGWSPKCHTYTVTDETKWGVLKTTAVQPLSYQMHHHKELPEKLSPKTRHEVQVGDLLITRAGPKQRVGISCVVHETRPKLMISDKIIRFHLLAESLLPDFVILCLNAGYSQEFMESQKSGMAESQMNITQTNLKLTPIPIAPVNEQKKIIEKVRNLWSYCDTLEKQFTQQETTATELLGAIM